MEIYKQMAPRTSQRRLWLPKDNKQITVLHDNETVAY